MNFKLKTFIFWLYKNKNFFVFYLVFLIILPLVLTVAFGV